MGEKQGGCDHMTCRCGHHFFWSQVPTLAPCDDVISHPQYGVWGTTYENCTWKAHAKLAARRTGLIGAGIVATPFVLVGGVVVLAGAGTATLVKKARQAGPTSSDEVLEKARSAVELARAMVGYAEADLRTEEQKWFNRAAIDA